MGLFATYIRNVFTEILNNDTMNSLLETKKSFGGILVMLR